MKPNSYILIPALFIALICMGTTCRKDTLDYHYNFVEKVNLFPVQKSYNVYDTIWIQYQNPNKKLFDSKTNQLINADSVAVTFQVSFSSKYQAPTNPQDGFCDFVSTYGLNAGRYLSNFGSGLLLGFGCNSNNSYDFLIGVVPKYKGIYCLNLSNDTRPVSACSNRTTIFPYSTINFRFNVTDGNKDVYLSIPPVSRLESVKGFTEKAIDNKQVFVFRVE